MSTRYFKRGFGDVPPEGTPHPEFPGCLWNSFLNDYVCDDGYNANGDLPGQGSDGSDDTVITTDVAGPRVRSESELSAAITKAHGKLTVSGNSSELIVALNNVLRFSVKDNGDGYYEIQDRLTGNNLFLLGGAALLLVVVVLVSK